MWKENGRLNENSVKFRIIRQGYPDVGHWADTVYHRDPEGIELFVQKIEAEQLAVAHGRAVAEEKIKAVQESNKRFK
ncbi:MAG TPA: hypothetical protein VNI52_14345 [Sphingobacteriaceae bacterium]|nr:hypothetical protein [Sphingobacteriaceae bacterium]